MNRGFWSVLGQACLALHPKLLLHTHLQIEFDVFSKLTACFNALSFLGGCPTLTVPVGYLRDGSPVAITLLAVHK